MYQRVGERFSLWEDPAVLGRRTETMHEGMSLSQMWRECNRDFLRSCRENGETYCSVRWVIEFNLARDIAPNGGFTTRSARSGGPS